jgi:hypothetical protein
MPGPKPSCALAGAGAATAVTASVAAVAKIKAAFFMIKPFRLLRTNETENQLRPHVAEPI